MTSATFNNNSNSSNSNDNQASSGILQKVRYNLFNTQLFLNNIKRTRTFIILIGVVLFISCPFVGFLVLINDSHSIANANTMRDCAIVLSYIMFVEAIIFAVILSLYMMNYSHHKRANIFYTSLPIKKTCFFTTQFLSGFAYYLIPLIAIYIPTMLIFVPFSGALGAITLGFFFAILLFLLTYSMSVFAANIAGTAFNSIVTFIYLNAYVASLLGMIVLFISSFYVFATSDFLWQEGIFIRSSPIIYYFSKIFGYFGRYHDGTLFTYISALDIVLLFVIIIAFYVCALFLNKYNKAENAGKSINYKWFERIFKYSMFVLAAMVGGTVFYEGFNYNNVMTFVGIAIVVFITFMFMNIIIRHNIREVFTGIKKLGIFLVAASVIMMMFSFDIFGIDKYLPNASSVSSVSPGYYSNSAYDYRHEVSVVEDGRSHSYIAIYSIYPTITDPASIEMLNEIFKTAMDLSDASNYYNSTDDSTYYQNAEHGMIYDRIEYTLESGRKVTKNMPQTLRFKNVQDKQKYSDLVDKFLASDGVRKALFSPVLDDSFLADISSKPSFSIMVKMFKESYTEYSSSYYGAPQAVGNLVLSQNINMAQFTELINNARKDIQNIKQLSSWYSDGVQPTTIEVIITYMVDAELHTHTMTFHSRSGTKEYAEYVNLVDYLRSNFQVLEN